MNIYEVLILIGVILPIVWFFLITLFFRKNKKIVHNVIWLIFMIIIHICSEVLILESYLNSGDNLNYILLFTKILIFIFPVISFGINYINFKVNLRVNNMETAIRNVIKNSLK